MSERDEKQSRQSALGRSLSATGGAAMKPVKATSSVVLKSAEMAGAVARQSFTLSIDATADAFKRLQGAYDKGVDTVFPECPVAAFLLPLGPNADDYYLVFDLDELLSSLQTGVFVRPRIDLWAASDSHDAHHLAEEIATRFAEELGTVMQRTVAEGEAKIAVRREIEDELTSEVWSELWGPTLGSWAFWTTAFSVGVVPGCLLLWMGQRPRMEIFGITADYLDARSDRSDAESRFVEELKRTEREFKSKSKAFERAVSNLGIRIHPRLQEVLASFDSTSDGDEEIVGLEAEAEGYPDVESYLEHPMYLQALSSRSAMVDVSGDSTRSHEGPMRGFFKRIFSSE